MTGANDAGLQRSAILMMTLGEDAAAEVFKHLTAREVQAIGAAMAGLKQITREEVNEVLEEFREEADQVMAVTLGSSDYIRSVLIKALGSERAASIIEDILESRTSTSGVDALNWLEPHTVAELVREEHPQIIATILVHLDRQRAAEVLALLEDRLRSDVVLRIATFGGVQPTALHELTEVLNEIFAGQGAKRSRMGGPRTAAEIINLMSSAHEDAIIETLRERDPDLAQKVVDEMFVFENLIDLEDRAIQLLLKEIDPNSLVVALKGADEALRDKFMRNMSMRAAEILRDDLENMGPVRMSQVDAEQKKILSLARRLAETGQIVLTTRGDDTYV